MADKNIPEWKLLYPEIWMIILEYILDGVRKNQIDIVTNNFILGIGPSVKEFAKTFKAKKQLSILSSECSEDSIDNNLFLVTDMLPHKQKLRIVTRDLILLKYEMISYFCPLTTEHLINGLVNNSTLFTFSAINFIECTNYDRYIEWSLPKNNHMIMLDQCIDWGNLDGMKKWFNGIDLNYNYDLWTLLYLQRDGDYYSANIYHILAKMCIVGSLEMIQYVFPSINPEKYETILTSDLVVSAIENENLELLSFFYEKSKLVSNKLFDNVKEIIDSASYDGNFEAIKWFWQKHLNKELNFDYKRSLGHTVNRYPEIFQWFWEKIEKSELPFRYSKHFMEECCWHGRLDLIKKVYQICTENEIVFKYSYLMMENACFNDNLETLEWLWNTNRSDFKNLIIVNNAIDNAAISGHLNVIKWFWDLSQKNEIDFDYGSALDYAVSNNHSLVINWFFERYDESSYFKLKYTSHSIDGLIKTGNLDKIKSFKRKLKSRCLDLIISTQNISTCIECEEYIILKWLSKYYEKDDDYRLFY